MQNGWNGIRAWLKTSDADWFLDDAVYGALKTGDMADLLADFGVAETPENLRRLGRLMDEVLVEA